MKKTMYKLHIGNVGNIIISAMSQHHDWGGFIILRFHAKLLSSDIKQISLNTHVTINTADIQQFVR